MTRTYTAADFANARFAEHENGDTAVRWDNSGEQTWESSEQFLDDDEMADEGWVPVPTKPTITESQFSEAVEAAEIAPGVVSAIGLAAALRIEIIPDPEPTNTDRLEELIISAPGNFEGVEAILKRPANVRAWAKYLDNAGVAAPKENNNG